MSPEERYEFDREDGPVPGRSLTVAAAVMEGVLVAAVFLVPVLASLFLWPLAFAVVVCAAIGIGKGDRFFGGMVILCLPFLWLFAFALGGPS